MKIDEYIYIYASPVAGVLVLSDWFFFFSYSEVFIIKAICNLSLFVCTLLIESLLLFTSFNDIVVPLECVR